MKRKPVKTYSKEQLERAVQAVREGSTQFAAAKRFGIPRSTLFNKVSGKSEIGKKSGPGTVLSAKEEDCIEKWVHCLAERGFPVVKQQLLQTIQLYLNTNKRQTPFVDNYPGRKWYQNFLQRHPMISKRIAQNLTKSRAAVTEVQLKAWHEEVQKYCEENNLLEALNDPKRVFNMDEKGFILCPKNEVVLAKKGQKAVYNRVQNDEKECVTALLGGNAAGMTTPPMLVYPFKRMPSNILLELPPKWSVGISETGWQTQRTFNDYISDVFCPWLLENQIEMPIILFIDGHKSHISLSLSEFCSSHQIELIALYPNATHIIQPMDVAVFKPLGSSWDVKLKDWKKVPKNVFARVDKKDIAPILRTAIEGVDYKGLLQKGFRRCGLFPFKFENINLSRLLPVNEITENQLYGDENEDGAEQKRIQNEQEILHRLKVFEELIDANTLKGFRSSYDEWTGPVENTSLFVIWKKLHAEASVFTQSKSSSNDLDAMVIDVESLDSDTVDSSSSTSSIVTFDDASIFIVGENGQLLKSDGSDCIENEILFDGAMDVIVNDMGEIGANEQHAVNSCSDIISVNENAVKEIDSKCPAAVQQPVASNVNNPIESETETIEPRVIVNDSCNDTVALNANHLEEMEADQCRETGSASRNEFNPNSVQPTNGIRSQVFVPHSETFDQESFKKLFLIPQPITSKKQKKSKEKVPTVITSEAWKESEKKKLEEKERVLAEKVARKLQREEKKVLVAKEKAEKEIVKAEKKKLAAQAKAENEIAKERKRIEMAEKKAAMKTRVSKKKKL